MTKTVQRVKPTACGVRLRVARAAGLIRCLRAEWRGKNEYRREGTRFEPSGDTCSVESPPEPFRDDADAPRFAQCAVLFLDLLGTASVRESTAMLDRLTRTKRAVEQARELTPTDENGHGLWNATWFSDNLGLYYAVSGPVFDSQALGFLVTDVGWLQLAFLSESLVARGGIAFGEFYADRNFIHGPALDRAVELEKRSAIFPRVVLDDAALSVVQASLTGEYFSGLHAPWRRQLLVDEKGVVFVDYLATLNDYDSEEPSEWLGDLMHHRDFIVRSVEEASNNEHVLAKYVWVAAYHNDFLRRYEWFLGDLVDDLTVEKADETTQFLPYGHDIDPPDDDC